MKYVFCLSVLFSLMVAAAPEAAAEEAADESGAPAAVAVSQAISAEVEQRAFLQESREAALGLSDWWLELQADAAWSLRIGSRLSLSVSPRVEWRENGGTAKGFDFDDREADQEEAVASLHRAEVALSLSEWGLELLAGKLRPQFGVNYIEPLSVMNLRGRDSYDDGLWLSGLLFTTGVFSLEAYGQVDSDPVVFSSLSALVDVHEFGFLYKRAEGGISSADDFFGVWVRTQVGDGLIPYAEVAFRTGSGFLDLDGQEERDFGGNGEALAGLGWSPADVNLSVYLEYRFRQAGYDGGDWDSLGSLGLRDVGAYLPDFPYLQTSRHALGLHLQSQDEILDLFTWSATCIYLFPGLYTQARLEAAFVERCSIGLKGELASDLGRSDTEAAFWPHEGRLTLYATWKINAREDASDVL